LILNEDDPQICNFKETIYAKIRFINDTTALWSRIPRYPPFEVFYELKIHPNRKKSSTPPYNFWANRSAVVSSMNRKINYSAVFKERI